MSSRKIITELQSIIERIESFVAEHSEVTKDGADSLPVIKEATEKLKLALINNQIDYAEARQEARYARETSRAENGYPE